MFRRRPVAPHQAVVAAATAMALDGSSWRDFKLGDQKWQQEAWRHYDICGELRSVSNWIGNAVSRCRLYVAEIDDVGRPGEEVTDEEIGSLAETMFGGPGGRAEAQRALGIHLTVPGEAYICAESVDNAKEDIWYIVSTSEISRSGETIKVKRSHIYGGGTRELVEGQDLLIRVWTPHPRRHDMADSSVRPALPILRQIEQLTKRTAAQIDSRLAGAGLLFVPQGMDFPRGEDDPAGVPGLMATLQRSMAASLQDQGNASALAPIMVEADGQFIKDIKWLTFETPLDELSGQMTEKAIGRLALALDVPPEVLLGQGDSNHWSAWQIEETAVKIHIVPVLSRIAEALTSAYLRPALKILGEDPEKFCFWYDTSPLTVRPDRTEDAEKLHTGGLISDETRRSESGFSEDDAPTDEERQRRLLLDLVKLNTNLLGDPVVREVLGLPAEMLAPAPAPEGQVDPTTGQALEPAPTQRALPQAPTGTDTPAQAAGVPSPPTSSGVQGGGFPGTHREVLHLGANLLVRRAMELAGKRLLTREARSRYPEVPAHELHTRLRVLDNDHALRLLDGAFDGVPEVASWVGIDADELTASLSTYCVHLLTKAYPHDQNLLWGYLKMGLDNAR